MSDLAALTAQYLVTEGQVPRQFDNTNITPILDGKEYNQALEAALAQVGTGATPAANAGHYIYINNWQLGLAGGVFDSNQPSLGVQETGIYCLDGPGGSKKLIDILKQKARLGVDVRAAAWVLRGMASNFWMAEVGADKVADINNISMKAIAALREEPKIGMKAILTQISHPSGTVHMKVVIIGTPTMAKAFTGGIDLVNDRFAEIGHIGPANYWHDMALLVEGDGVRAIYEFYRDMWNESIVQPPERFKRVGITIQTHQTEEPGNTPIVDPFVAVSAGGPYRIQSLRTVPAFNFEPFNTLPSPDPISWAPDGLFEFREGLKKAISGARRYIYIEDQAFTSVEIMTWLHDAIVQQNQLRVILLTGGVDPADPQQPRGYLARAVNVGLLRGGDVANPELTPLQRDRVRLLKRSDDELFNPGNITAVTTVGNLRRVTLSLTASRLIRKNEFEGAQIRVGAQVFPIVAHEAMGINDFLVFDVQPGPVDIFTPAGVVPVVGPMQLWGVNDVIVHAKLVMVDDNVMICGSANQLRRALYSEWEHSVSVVDPADALVRDTRCRVWADHFRHATPADFADIGASLNAWVPGWGTAATLPPRRGPHILEIPFPIVAPALTEDQIEYYDEYLDIDSRENWGGFCPARPDVKTG
jgi:phosphatidylserine/phosphatidylglycerophosphate/cardiolipin synthase-like enzyme